jgi:hypothetical protein
MTTEATRTIVRQLPGIQTYPELVKLVTHCRELADGRELPNGGDFHPAQIRWMFGHLYIADVVDGGADYRCRLWGQFWETIFGLDLRGMRLSELERAGHVLHLRAEYDAIVADRSTRFRTGRVVWPDGKTVNFARVIIPFADDSGNVAMLLSGGSSEMTPDDLAFFKGLGMPSFVFDNLSKAPA